MPYTGAGVIEDGIAEKLKATTAVTNLCSTRVFTARAPEDTTFPFIVITKQPGEMHNVLTSAGRTGIEMASVLVNCWGSTYESARKLATQVAYTIDGQTGTWGTEEVMFCGCESQQDISQQPTQDDEIGYPGIGMSFKTIYRVPLS
jgi:hypothetical protein